MASPRAILAVLLLSGVAARSSGANQLFVDLDPAKTQIAFLVSDTLHSVHGFFRLKKGHISFDPATSRMSGDIVVDASSGNSGSVARDRRMTREILQAQQFLEIRFSPSKKSGSIAPTGASEVDVTGTFLIHGKSHEVTVRMHVEVSGNQVLARGTFLVPYVEWGMKNPSNFLIKVQDKVEVSLMAVGHTSSTSANAR